MAVRKFKPTTPGQRHKIIGTFEEITASVPEKSLVYGKKSSGGRNSEGKMTMRYIGGGHRKVIRIVDFKRNKDGVPAVVKTIEYDPNRTARIALIVYADSTTKVSMANKIAADLTSIGIPVKVRELSWDNYQDALKGGKFDKFDMYYGEVALPADFDLSALLKAGGSLNYGGITTGTYADVINAYLAAADSDRAAACGIMLQTISDTAPIVPVCFEKHCLYVHRGAVGGFSPTKYNIFHNITDWKINNA